MGFEKYVHGSRSATPKLSIRRAGQIGLNRAAVIRYELENVTHAVLYYDRERAVIGIELTNDASLEGALRLKHRYGSASVSAKAFFEFYNIPYEQKASRYRLCKNEEDGLLTAKLDLKEKSDVTPLI